jgi:hypothetical protein
MELVVAGKFRLCCEVCMPLSEAIARENANPYEIRTRRVAGCRPISAVLCLIEGISRKRFN